MTACLEPGCGGSIAADGYCDTCGAAKAQPRASSPAQSPHPPAQSPNPPAQTPAPVGRAATGGCDQAGCGGTIAADGYCDTCGSRAGGATTSAPISNSVPAGGSARAITGGGVPSSGPVTTSTSGTVGLPVPPTLSSRLPGAGTATARSRSTASSRSQRTGGSALGAGLVEIAPTDVGDPAAAVMSDERIQAALGAVPEDRRVCSSCGSPVGRSEGETEGRVKGFCGQCRTPFDFITNRPTLQADELVAGQYRISGPLAHGGMGWIYLGRDEAVSGRWVVLKGLLNEDDPDAVAAAVAERRFLAQIQHGNIVDIYNFVTHRGAGYIVMEMVGGASLNSKLKQRRAANGGVPDPLPVVDAIAYILGVLPAFGYLHERGLVYNDLKPANIMAVADGVKLIDVGAVMRIGDDQAAIFGTQGFQAPEVASTGPSIASDLYTVGRTLAVLMLRFVFHTGPYLHALPSPDEEPIFARWESLYRFLLRSTANHPDDRFQSAEDMTRQLTGVLREIVSVTEGQPHTVPSAEFEGDQLPGLLVSARYELDVLEPTWRVLPPALVDPTHPDAAFLMSLDELPADQSNRLLREAIGERTIQRGPEVDLRLVWHQLRAAEPPTTAIDKTLDGIEMIDPWDWRIAWCRGLNALASDRPAEAADRFSRVWTELPGETAAKFAVALAAELAGDTGRAHHLYDLITRCDAGYVSAAFGLARCNQKLNRTQEVVEALNRVPNSSAVHYEAQVASAQILVEGGATGTPSAADLAAAADTVERLQLDAHQRASISADIFERALDGLAAGRLKGGADTIFTYDLDERSMRMGLEEAYRLQARLADDPIERQRLVDRANRVRPWSLF